MRITERETRQLSCLVRRGEETHLVIPEGVQMEEYTEEQIPWMDMFHKKHQTSVFAPNSCTPHASGHRGPKTQGGGLSGRKRRRSEQSEQERGPRFRDFMRLSSKKIMDKVL